MRETGTAPWGIVIKDSQSRREILGVNKLVTDVVTKMQNQRQNICEECDIVHSFGLS